jgi:hypothetical protein
MQKRGLSNIVTTVLIILLVIAAVAIIWMFINRTIKSSTDAAKTQMAFASLNFKITNIQLDPNNNLKFTLEHAGGEQSIKGFKVLVKDNLGGVATIDYYENVSITSLEAREIVIYQSSADGNPFHGLSGNITEVSVYAIIDTPQGPVTAPAPVVTTSGSGGGGGGGGDGDDEITPNVECVGDSGCTAQVCGGKCTNNVCDYQKVTFNKTFGGSGEDSSLSIIPASDGYVISGYGGFVSWIFKTNLNGVKQWEKRGLGSPFEDGSISSTIISTSDGFVTTGFTTSSGKYNLALMKLNASGSKEWFKEYTGNYDGFELGISMIKNSEGYSLIGNTFMLPNNKDIWLIKTNLSGDHVWNKTFGGAAEDATHFEHSLVQASDGYIFTGSTNSFGAGSNDVWLIKTDFSGNQLWNKTFGGANHDEGFSLINVSDGYLVAGSTSSFGAGSNDVWLIKTNLSGDHVWNKTFGGANSDSAYSIIQTSNGYVLTGGTASFGAGSNDVWLIKTDFSGNQLWNKTFGGANIDNGMSVIQSSDGGYAIAGRTYSFGAGDLDIWFIKTDANGCIRP